MKRKVTKTIAVLMTLAMLIGIMPTMAFADEAQPSVVSEEIIADVYEAEDAPDGKSLILSEEETLPDESISIIEPSAEPEVYGPKLIEEPIMLFGLESRAVPVATLTFEKDGNCNVESFQFTGDTTNDGEITSADAELIEKYVNEKVPIANLNGFVSAHVDGEDGIKQGDLDVLNKLLEGDISLPYANFTLFVEVAPKEGYVIDTITVNDEALAIPTAVEVPKDTVAANGITYTVTLYEGGKILIDGASLASNHIKFTCIKENKQTTGTDIQVAQKKVTGTGATLADGQFSFELAPLVQQPAGGFKFGAETEADTITVTNDINGKIYINSDKFTQSFYDKYCVDATNSGEPLNGSYTFLISEINDDQANYNYDDSKYILVIYFYDGEIDEVTALYYKYNNATGIYTANAVTDTFYSSSGWSFDDDSPYKNNIGYVPFNNQYVKNSVEIVYDANGGEGAPAKVTVSPNIGTYTLDYDTVPTHDKDNGKDVVFIGWTKTQDTKIYSNGDTLIYSVIGGVSIADSDVTVYALYGYDENNNGIADVKEAIALTYGTDGHGEVTEWMLKGDANRDKAVSDEDSQLIGDIISKDLILEDIVMESAKVNFDDSVTQADRNIVDGIVRGGIPLPVNIMTFRVVDTPNAGYMVGAVFITTNAEFIILTPEVQTYGDYKLEIDEDGVATVTGQSLRKNNVQFIHIEEYTVIYDANGGAASDGSTTCTDSGIAATDEYLVYDPAIAGDFTNEGYTFTGWNTEADGSGDDYKALALVALTAVNGKTLYAQWEKNNTGGSGSTKYSVTLTKVDREDNDKALSGAKFELYKENGTLLGAYTTNRDGELRVSGLSNGDYYFIETVAPDGYKLDDSKQEFTINRGNEKLTVENRKSTADDTDDETGKTDTTDAVSVPDALNSKEHIRYVAGYPDGTIQPNRNITRAEVASMLYRLLTDSRRDDIMTSANSFSDVTDEDWFNTAVSSMAEGDYVSGYPDGTFGGNRAITRAEFVAIAARFIDAQRGNAEFSDVSEEHWAYKSIATAVSYGWVSGYPDGTFRPDQLITRAEAISIINRMLDRGVDEEGLMEGYVEFTDNSEEDWYYYEIIEATNGHEYTGSRPSESWTEITTN